MRRAAPASRSWSSGRTHTASGRERFRDGFQTNQPPISPQPAEPAVIAADDCAARTSHMACVFAEDPKNKGCGALSRGYLTLYASLDAVLRIASAFARLRPAHCVWMQAHRRRRVMRGRRRQPFNATTACNSPAIGPCPGPSRELFSPGPVTTAQSDQSAAIRRDGSVLAPHPENPWPQKGRP